jgi:hypothetical protein
MPKGLAAGVVGLDNVQSSHRDNLRVLAGESIPSIMSGTAVKHHNPQFGQQIDDAFQGRDASF